MGSHHTFLLLPSHRHPQDSTMVNTSMWNREKRYWWAYLQGRNKDADVTNGLVDTRWGKERLGRGKRVALIYIRYHMRNSLLVGNHCTAQGAQLSALGWPRGVGWGGSGKESQQGRDMCIHRADSRCCTAETNTTLSSNDTPMKQINKAERKS